MSRRTVFEYMPGRRTDMIEHSDDSVTFNTYQDVEPILEYNKMMMNEYGDKLTPGKRGTWHKVASVPTNVWEQWLIETDHAIEKDKKLLNKYLNDPDNRIFKTSPTNL